MVGSFLVALVSLASSLGGGSVRKHALWYQTWAWAWAWIGDANLPLFCVLLLLDRIVNVSDFLLPCLFSPVQADKVFLLPYS